jgi:hypothetical protein
MMHPRETRRSGLMSDTNHGIPNGVGHVKMLDVGALHALRTGEEALKAKEERNLEFIGVCMTALYQAATCHRECYGGQHLLEALCGRAYNLSAAAIHLAKIGYYDEALNLVRGIGEIANLVALGAVDQTAIKEWLEADEKTRRNKFSPARVRDRLSKTSVVPMIATQDWYSKLCEKYTHITPKTKPNFHNEERPMCGGFFQEKGLDEALGRLAAILGFLAMFVCKFFKFEDLFGEISSILRSDDALDIIEDA